MTALVWLILIGIVVGFAARRLWQYKMTMPEGYSWTPQRGEYVFHYQAPVSRGGKVMCVVRSDWLWTLRWQAVAKARADLNVRRLTNV